MKTARSLLAALLAAILLTTPLLAAGPYEADHAKRAQDLDFLVENLEKVHPDMYANTTPQAVADKKAYIEQNMDNWNDTALSLEYRALIGLLADSHTNMGIKVTGNYQKLLLDIGRLGDKWILSGAKKEYARFVGGEIISMGGLSMAEVQQRFGTALCADNDVRAKRVMGQMLHLWDVLHHIGVVQADQKSLDITIRATDGTTGTISVAPMTNDETNAMVVSGELADMVTLLPALRTAVPATEPESVYYKWLDLGDGSLYIQYNACFEDPELPMADFAAQVAQQLGTDAYGRVIIDLRNNGGGSDGVIWDLLYEILPYQQRGVALYGLIGDATFSSALINAVQLKQLGATLVGTPTGGSVDHFGQVGSFQLPNSGWNIGYSNKFIDMGSYYQSAAPYGVESLKPDISAPQTVSDYLAGVDTAVQAICRTPATAPTPATATASTARVTVNGQPTDLVCYEIGGQLYAALRDVAMVLTGTGAQFDVAWHKADGLVEIVPQQPYTAVGGELGSAAAQPLPVRLAALLLVKPGLPIQLQGAAGQLPVLRIGEAHYAGLEALGQKLGFAVRLSDARTEVAITTK